MRHLGVHLLLLLHFTVVYGVPSLTFPTALLYLAVSPNRTAQYSLLVVPIPFILSCACSLRRYVACAAVQTACLECAVCFCTADLYSTTAH